MLLQETYKISRQAMEKLVQELRYPDADEIRRANEHLDRISAEITVTEKADGTTCVKFENLDLSFLDEGTTEPTKYVVPLMKKFVSVCNQNISSFAWDRYAFLEDAYTAA